MLGGLETPYDFRRLMSTNRPIDFVRVNWSTWDIYSFRRWNILKSKAKPSPSYRQYVTWHSGIFFRFKRNIYLQLRSLRHENVNMMMGCFCHETNPALLFEYCSRGSLNEILRRQDLSLDWTFQLSLLTDLVRVFGLFFRLWVYSEEIVFVAWLR